jgi:hypothetical protein
MAANVDFYQNELKKYLSQPGAFEGSPGFKFALDQGTQAIGRSNSATRSGGNVLAELMKYGVGLAAQDRGNEIDRLGRLSGQEQQYDLGLDQNANTRRGQDLDFGLGMYGARTNRMGVMGSNWGRAADYDLGRRRLSLDDRNSGWDNERDWFRARTDRGRAMSDDYWNADRSNQGWWGLV